MAACAEKYPGEGSSNFDRQVTDRRWYLPGKYRAASRKNATGRYLQSKTDSCSWLQRLGRFGCHEHVVALSSLFFFNKRGTPEARMFWLCVCVWGGGVWGTGYLGLRYNYVTN